MRLSAINHQNNRLATDPLHLTQRPMELTLLGLALLLHAAIYIVGLAELYDVINWITPSLVVFTLGWSCFRMVTQSAVTVWIPLFWFRLACAAYYGVGAVVPLVADYDLTRSFNGIYILDSAMLVKVNLVTITGIFLVLFTSSLVIRLAPFKYGLKQSPASNKEVSAMRFAIVFLTIGCALRYGLVLPYTFGLFDTVLPGAVIAVGQIYYAGIYLLIRSLRGDHQGRIVVAIILVILEIMVSITSFAKTEIILILIFVYLGVLELKKGVVFSVSGMVLIAVVYLSFQPLVMYGRERVMQVHGSIIGAGLGERWGIVHDYVVAGARSNQVGYVSGLGRLSYASPNAFVINQYDSGISGNTLRHVFAVLVPRAVWPDKPIITDIAQDLYFSVSGQHGSAMAVGHFSEAYWNFGWMGLLIIMLPLGVLLTIYSSVSLSIMSRQDWLLLPIVFMGVQIGLRVDGFFVPDVVGGIWMALVAWMALSIIVGSTAARRRTR